MSRENIVIEVVDPDKDHDIIKYYDNSELYKITINNTNYIGNIILSKSEILKLYSELYDLIQEHIVKF